MSLPRPGGRVEQTAGVAVELLVRFARTGHQAGYPTADLEERVVALAAALGFEDAQVSATPTMIDVSLGAVPHQRSFTLRVRPTAVDLDVIACLDDSCQLRTCSAAGSSPTRRSLGWPRSIPARSSGGGPFGLERMRSPVGRSPRCSAAVGAEGGRERRRRGLLVVQ